MAAVLDKSDMQSLLDRLGPLDPKPSLAPPLQAAAQRPDAPSRWRAGAALLAGGVVLGLGAALAYTSFGAPPSVAATAAPAAPQIAATPATPALPATSADSVALQGSGYVVAERQATVSAEVTGRLAALHVRSGDRVRRGQLLAELDPSALDAQRAVAAAELAAQQQSDQELAVQLRQAQAALARTEALQREGFVSPAQVENERYKVDLLASQRGTRQRQIDVAQQQLQLQRRLAGQLRVLAPFDGIVTDSPAQVGEIVSPISAAGGYSRSGIATVVDLASLQVEVKVSEKFIHRVRPGQPVWVSLHADSAVRQQGHVVAVMPAAERETGAIKVRIALDQPDARVLPNMGVDVSFLASSPQAAVTPSTTPGVSS